MGPQKQQTTPVSGLPDHGGFVAASTDTTLSEALIVLRKRRWVLVLAVIFGLIYGLYKAASQPRPYDAYGRIEVRSGSSNEYRVSGGGQTGGSDFGSHLQTEVTILQSDSLMLTVAREMDLANNADFLGAKGPLPHRSLEDPSVRQATIHRLQSSLKIQLVPKTDIIRIGYSSLSAKLSADIVNKVIFDYIQRSYETRFASTQRVSQWLSSQLDDLKQQVETSQEQMIDLQKRLGVLGLGIDQSHSQNQLSEAIDSLAAAASQARIQRIIAESRYRVLNGSDMNTMEGTIENTPGTAPGELNALRAQLAALRTQYALETVQLGPNHPTVVKLKSQIDELTRELSAEQNRVVTQAKQNYVAARASEEQTNAALEGQKAEAYKLRDDLVEYTLRQREFESNRSLYEGLLQRLRAAGVQAGLESLEIDVVDQALPPASPTLQAASTIIITTLVFSLIAGIVLAFLLESLDTGLRGIAEIESITELPSLAIVPRARKNHPDMPGGLSTAQMNIQVLTMPKSQFAEAFRSLRTSLLLSSVGKPPKIILFTSATPSEGKTTTATNIACILAQRDTKVLLLDGDLRRPNVHHRFGLNGKVGVSTVLTGSTTLEEAVQRVPEVPNLDILPSGPVPPFPTEMLGSEAMLALLERCSTLYTHIVIDSPPILSVTDGVVLARLADAVVLVVRHGKSSKHIVRRARDLLLRSGAPITGIVLNAVDLNSPEYYGYYGYSGYSYSSIDSDSWESQVLSSDKRKAKKP